MTFRFNLSGGMRLAGSLLIVLTGALIAACGSDAAPTAEPSPTPIVTYELEVVIEPQEAASYILNPIPDDRGTYREGTIVTVDVLAKGGWQLERWVGPAFDIAGETARVNMDSSHTVAVRFVRIVSATPTVTPTPTAATPRNTVVVTVKSVSSPTIVPASGASRAIQRPSGLVSWWPGDGNANDISGDNHGNLSVDTTFAPGMVAQGFSFDEAGDFVLVPDSASLNITGDVTVDLWAKRTGFGELSIMVVKGASGIDGAEASPSAYLLRFVNNRLAAEFGRADGSNAGLLGPTVADSNFHHFAYVRSGNTHKLFMDSAVVAGRYVQRTSW